jgi:hypothetical protein
MFGALWLSVLPLSAQFSSGSTGADGALTFTTAGSYYFDPTTITGHAAGDTIFNFTNITIGSGVTVRLDSRKLAGPVYWLASGAVEIDGTLDLSGFQGHPVTNLQSQRLPSTPGAGGYAGGVGGGGAFSASSGFGPGGGAAAANSQCCGAKGTFTGSQYLIPLVGGSGGGGGVGNCNSNTATFNGGGGAGGGAILIASSASITLKGLINATGGLGGGGCGSGGSGGAVRLVANSISFNAGSEIAIGGGGGLGGVSGGSGFVRLEGNSVSTANLDVNGGSYIAALPSAVSVPANGPAKIMATSVNGMPIMANPFSFPDAPIDSASAIPIVISAQYVPLNATISLYVYSEDGADQVISVPALTGALASSTTTVNVTYPPQGSWGLIRATWQ